MYRAEYIVKWFLDNGITMENSLKGNIKINKLLVFSQLLYFSKYNIRLFSEDMYAFKHGLVIEDIRKEYKNYYRFINKIKEINCNFSEKETSILDLTCTVFGNLSSDILSELTHQFQFWKDKYNKSRKGSYHNTELSIIDFEELNKIYIDDLNKIRDFITVVEEDNELAAILINNTTFYYNPKETKVTSEIMNMLKRYATGNEDYSFYIDESQGLVVY